jgi:RNA polymerase sigma-70 factor (ECF subfamily)
MAAWVTEHVIPHERAVRASLARHASLEDVDDLIQEAYSRCAALESVDHIGRPDAYFFSIARNLLIQRLRRARIVPIEAFAEIDSYQDDMRHSPEHEAINRIDFRRMMTLIEDLPERRRHIVRMRKLDGYSQREIAELLDVSESIVENEIFRGVQAVQRAWRDGEAQAEASLTALDGREHRP